MTDEQAKSSAATLSPEAAREMMMAGIEPEIRALGRLDARKRWFELAFFPILWVAGAALTLWAAAQPSQAIAIPLWLCGILISATALNAFVLLVHEAMHGLLFQNRTLNRWTGVLFGCTVLTSFTAYKIMHLRHHRYLGDARDPDDYDNYSRSRRMVWTLHFMRLAIGSYLYLLMIPAMALRHGREGHRRAILAEYAILVALWAAVIYLTPWRVILEVWALPVMLVAAMTNIRGFTQHGITDAHDPFLASRSIHPNRVVSFLLLHENLHLEHHLFPEIPSYNLARVQELITPKLPRAATGRSYVGFIWRFVKMTFQPNP